MPAFILTDRRGAVGVMTGEPARMMEEFFAARRGKGNR